MKVLITEHYSDEKGNAVVEISTKQFNPNAITFRMAIVHLENDEEFTLVFLNEQITNNEEYQEEGWTIFTNKKGEEVYAQYDTGEYLRTYHLI